MSSIPSLILIAALTQAQDPDLPDLPKRAREHIRQLEKAKDWLKLAEFFESYPDTFVVRVEVGDSVPLWQNAHRALAAKQFTKGGAALGAYRLKYDGETRNHFDLARKNGDVRRMHWIVDRRFLSSVGDDAADWLANRYFHAGRTSEAVELWRRILEHPDPGLSPKTLAAKLAQAGYRFEALNRPLEKVRIGNQKVRLWDAVVEQGLEKRAYPRTWSGPTNGRDRAAFQRIADKAYLAYADRHSVRVVEATRRDAPTLWSWPDRPMGPDSPLFSQMPYPDQGLGVYDRRVYVAYSKKLPKEKPRKRRRRREVPPPNIGNRKYIKAFDVRTGAELWDVELQHEDFNAQVVCSGPVFAGNAVVFGVVSERGDLELGAVAFDRITGKKLWYQGLDRLSRELIIRGAGLSRMPVSVGASGETAFVHTSYDTVAALHARSGRIRWATRVESGGPGGGVPTLSSFAPGRLYCISAGRGVLYRIDERTGWSNMVMRVKSDNVVPAPGGWLILTGSRAAVLREGRTELIDLELDVTAGSEPLIGNGCALFFGVHRGEPVLARYRLTDWALLERIPLEESEAGVRRIADWTRLALTHRGRFAAFVRGLFRFGDRRSDREQAAVTALTEGFLWNLRRGRTERARTLLRSIPDRELVHVMLVDVLGGDRNQVLNGSTLEDRLAVAIRVMTGKRDQSRALAWRSIHLRAMALCKAKKYEEAFQVVKPWLVAEGDPQGVQIARIWMAKIVQNAPKSLRDRLEAEAEVLLRTGDRKSVERLYPATAAATHVFLSRVKDQAARRDWKAVFESTLESTRPQYSNTLRRGMEGLIRNALPAVKVQQYRADLKRAVQYYERRRGKK